MNIRNMTVQDYLEVDQLMQQLHKLHVKGRPDLYVDLQHHIRWKIFDRKKKVRNIFYLLQKKMGKYLEFVLLQ